MRKAGIVIGILIAVVVVAFLVFWVTFDINEHRGAIQAEIQDRLGRPVTLGEMRLSLFRSRFQVDQLSIADDPRFENPKPFVQAEQLSVSVNLLPLLRGRLVVTSLNLRRPLIELIKSQQGVWNYSSLGAHRPSTPSASTQPSDAGSFSLDSLVIEGGQLALTDRQTQGPRAVYSPIDLTLKDFAPDKPFSVEIAFRLPGEGADEVRLQGSGGPVPPGDVAATPFHGTLDLSGVGLAGIQQFLNEPSLANTEGVLTGETRIDIESGTASADGSIEIRDARVRGIDLGYPIAVQYRLAADLKTDLLTISKATIKLGETALHVSGTIDGKEKPAQLGLNLKADRLALAEVARLASAFGVAFSPDMAVKGRVDADIRISGPVDNPVLNGNFSAGDVEVSGKEIPQPVAIKSVSFALTPAEIRSNSFDIVSGGTTVKSNVAVSQYTSQNPRVNASLEAPNAQLPAILGIAKAYGVKALDSVTGNGALKLNMRLSGPVESLRGDAILRALNGDAGIDFNKLRFTGTNMSQEISKVAGFLKPAGTNTRFTDISKMTGKITVKDGIAQTQDLRATLDVGTIAVTGSADLVSQLLDLRVNAVIEQAVSRQVGGSGIAGFMKTALANDQGELIVPVIVTGTFQQPNVSPDTQSFVKMKLKGLLPTSSNPAAGWSGLVDTLLGGGNGSRLQPGQTPQQPKQEPAQDALKQLLEGLSGTKKQKDDPQERPK